MRDSFQVVYKVTVQEEELEPSGERGGEGETINRQLVTLSCVGVGFSNFSKGIL